MENSISHNSKKLSRRSIRNLLYGFLKPKLPSYLILYVNNICQLRCDMCFYWDSMQVKTAISPDYKYSGCLTSDASFSNLTAVDRPPSGDRTTYSQSKTDDQV